MHSTRVAIAPVITLFEANVGDRIILSNEAILFLSAKRQKLAMSNLEQIESAILSLPSNDFEKLRQWFFDLDYQRWDEQLERDIADGRLESLTQEAITEFQSGQCREL